MDTNELEDLNGLANLQNPKVLDGAIEKEQPNKRTRKQLNSSDSSQIVQHKDRLKIGKKSVPLALGKPKNAILLQLNKKKRNNAPVILETSSSKMTRNVETVSKKNVSEFIDNYDEYKDVII